MDAVIQDYFKAFTQFMELSKKETKIRIEMQQARQRLLHAKQEMHATEQELLDITNHNE